MSKSMELQKTGRGRIWPNDLKQGASQPDFGRTINVEGEEFPISAWKQS
jgi:hypothetical protein